MKIWLISIFEQTPVDGVFGTRFISIAEEALKRGHEVTFFASTFKHNTKNQRYKEDTVVDLDENYHLVFLRSLAYKRNVSLKRLYSHSEFADSFKAMLRDREKPDVILIAFPPIELTHSVADWAKENEVPFVIDIIDPWPEVFLNVLPRKLRFAGRFLFMHAQKSVGQSLLKASAVSAISNQYLSWAESLVKSDLDKHCFYPATDLASIVECRSNFKEKPVEKREDRLIVIYAGSLASSYDIPCILGAAEILEKVAGQEVLFKIAGSGYQEDLIRSYESNHKNLEFLGRLPKDELLKHYFNSDLGMTQHVRGATQSVTYKLFDLLGNGLPVLNSLESEMQDIIVQNEVGMHNAPGDAQQLADNILMFLKDPDLLRQYKTNALNLTEEKGDSKVVYGGMVDLLQKVAGQPAGPCW